MTADDLSRMNRMAEAMMTMPAIRKYRLPCRSASLTPPTTKNRPVASKARPSRIHPALSVAAGRVLCVVI